MPEKPRNWPANCGSLTRVGGDVVRSGWLGRLPKRGPCGSRLPGLGQNADQALREALGLQGIPDLALSAEPERHPYVAVEGAVGPTSPRDRLPGKVSICTPRISRIRGPEFPEPKRPARLKFPSPASDPSKVHDRSTVHEEPASG